jgi:hypothetical protein
MEAEIANLCRVCLIDDGLNMIIKDVFIGEVNLLKIMQIILYSVDWQNSWEIQGFPSKICPNCLMILKNAYLLNEKCIESEWKLQTLLKEEEVVEYLESEEAEIKISQVSSIKQEDFKHPKLSVKQQKLEDIVEYEEIETEETHLNIYDIKKMIVSKPSRNNKNKSKNAENKNNFVCDICNKSKRNICFNTRISN